MFFDLPAQQQTREMIFGLWPVGMRDTGAWEMVRQYQAQRHTAAVRNFRRIHGCDPHPLMNVHTLIAEYERIPTWEELAAKTADLTQRLDAAKAKHGIA